MKKQKTVLLLGSYGQKNLGDDLLMFNFLEFLTSKKIERIVVNASVVENIPHEIRKRFKNLLIYETYSTGPIEWLKILLSVDAVVYGGGTVFRELYKEQGSSRYQVLVRLSIFNIVAGLLLRKRIYNLHIGIGKLDTWLGRFFARLALQASTYSIFRDKDSYEFAKSVLLINQEKISYSTDGAFLIHQWSRIWNTAKIPAFPNKPIVGINILYDVPDSMSKEVYIQAIREFVSYLLSNDYFVVLMPFQSAFNQHNDTVFMERELVPYLHDKDNYFLFREIQLEQISSLYQQLDYFVGLRFHSLLLSVLNTVPFLAIEYDPKCTSFLRENNYPHRTTLSSITSKKLIVAFDELVNNQKQSKKIIREIIKNNQQKILHHLENIVF